MTNLYTKFNNFMGRNKLLFSLTALVFLFSLPAWTQSADFINNPQTNDVNIGDVFSVTIQVAPTSTEVSVAEVHLNFDPTLLQVVSLTPAGSPLGNTIVTAAFDNTMGTIEYGAYTLSDFPNTTFDFLTIEFEAVGLTPGTQVTHELVGFPVSLIAFEDVDLLDVANPIDVTITDPNQGVVCQEVLFRVNNGGVQTAAGDASTPDWGEDTQANPSPYVTLGSNNTFTTGTAIDMTHPSLAGTGITQAILQTERWVNTTPPVMQWDFPVTAGSEIQIKLFLAELFVNGPGERVFDVSVEGVVPPAFDNLDPFALAGAKFKGVMVSHTQTVNDNNLDMDFIHVVQNPAIKAIEVCLVSEPPPPCDFVTTVDPTDPTTCEGNGSVDIQVTGASMDAVITVLDANENPQNDLNNLPPGDYTYSVVDDGCEETGEFTINPYVDTQAPQISGCPPNIIVPAETGTCSATATWTPPTATDDCPDPVLLSDFQPGDNFPAGATTVTYTASDAAGNTSLCTFTVTVVDEESPSITCPGDQSGTLNANCEFILPDYTGDADASDDCDENVSVTQSPPAGTPVIGNTIVTLTATDGSGNSSNCSFDVAVSDETPPSILCPGNQVEVFDENNEFTLPDYTGLADASDNCDMEVSLAQSPGAGVIIMGNTTVTLTATDDAGNSSSCTFQVVAPSACEEVLFRVNNGGVQTAAGDASTPDWGEDTQANPSPFVTLGSNNTFTTGTAIDMTHPSLVGTGITQAILQSERWVNTTPPGMQWNFPVAPGSEIQIKLFFAELFVNNPGERVFDVSVEGVVPPAFDNIDPIALAGAKFKGVMVSHNLTVNDNNLDLDFIHVVQNPAIKAIEVCLVSEPPPPCDFVTTVDPADPTTCEGNGSVDIQVTGGSVNTVITVLDANENPQNDLDNLPPGDYTYTVVDEGCEESGEFTINPYVDTQAPQISGCPSNIEVPAEAGTCAATASWAPPTATDDCADPSLTGDFQPGDNFPAGITLVTYTASDAAGNSSLCTFTVTVVDEEPPSITCPGDQSGTLNANCEFILPDYTGNADASDDCDENVSVTQSPPAGTPVIGNMTVTLTATDGSGNSSSCSFEVTVSDETPPSITCPGNQVEMFDENDEFTLPDYTGLADASDNCDMEVSLAQSPGAGVIIMGNTTVTLTATDDAGNSSSCTFQVVAPSVCQEVLFRVNNGGVQTAAGDASTPDWGEDTQANPSPFVTLGSNNTFTTGTAIDMTHPSLVGTGITQAILQTERWVNTTPPVMQWNFPVAPGSEIQVKLFFAELFVNNPGERVFDVSVEGVVPPAFDNIDPIALAGAKFKGVMVSHNLTVNDNNLDLDFIHVVQNPAVKAIEVCLVSGEEPPCEFTVTAIPVDPTTCEGNGSVDIQVAGGSGNEVITVLDAEQNPHNDLGNLPPGDYTYTVVDNDCEDSGSFTINPYVDTQAPEISGCPSNIEVVADTETCSATASWTPPTATDDCSDPMLTSDFQPGDNFPTGITLVTYTASDAAGNSSLCTFTVTVTVVDDESPSITCPEDIDVGNDPGLCGADVFWDEPEYSDNCPGAILSGTNESGDFFAVGKSTVFLTVTDAAGNTTECSFNITVIDIEAPVFENCPAPITVAAGSPVCEAEASWTPPTATDNCPNPSVWSSHEPGVVFPFGITTVTYTAVDAAENSAVCSFTVTVEDQTPPAITCPGDQVGTLDVNDEFTLPDYTGLADVSDNCDESVEVTQDPVAGTMVTGNTAVTLTATDDAGNSSSCTFEVILSDELILSITCPGDQDEELDEDCELVLPDYTSLATVSYNGDEELTITQSPTAGSLITSNTTVTLTVTDESGNSSSCSFEVTVSDGTAPSITCPGDQMADVDVDCEFTLPDYTAEAVVSDNCDDDVSVTQSPLAGMTVTGNTTVTLTATDDAGNSNACSFEVTVLDETAPSITCPGDQSGTLNANCEFILLDYTTLADATDNCDDELEVTQSPSPGTPVTGNTTVTLTATDDAGNSSSCSFNVTVSDETAPSITCPGNQNETLDENNEFILPDYTGNATVSDNCDDEVSVTQNPPAGTTVMDNTTVTLTATDDAGNSSSCSFQLFLSEQLVLSITCPGDQTGSLNSNCAFVLPNYTALATVIYNGDENLTVTQSPAIGATITNNTTVTLTVNDESGNSSSCTFEVTVSDEIPPSITCPADQQEEVDADCEFNLPSYVNLATTIDNCGAGVSVTQSPLSGTIVTGNTTMTLTATDGAGNSNSCTFEVIVSDETSPSITCPGDQMVDVDANCEFSLLDYTADATVSDNCDEDVSVTQSPTAGTTVMGNTIVTLTATDDAGNSSNCTFEVIVSDGTPPSITCPGDQAEIVNADCELVLPDYTGLALAGDNCDSDLSISQSPLAGATVSGATTVTLTATDDAGNSSSCTFEVTVSDQTPPSIACPANQVEEVDADCELILANYTGLASVSDNCDENVSVTQSPAAGLTVIGNTMVTLTATDDSGNSSSCSFLVVVADMTPPSITCPANQTIPLDENCEFILPNYTALVTTSDNCDSNPTVSQSPVAGAAITENQVITLTVTDASGNSANCSFTITVFDAAPPSISCPDNIEVFNAPEQCGTIVIWALPSATDNCSPATVTSSANPGDFFEVGNTAVTYTATDDSGNSASCSFTVTVIDNEPPVLESCPSIIVTTNDPGQCGAIPTWQFPTATDNCSSVFVSGTAAPGEFFPVGFTTVVLSAADASGNTSLCSFGVAVLDGEAPQIECEDFTLSIVSDSTVLSADDVLSELSDNCEIAGVSLSQVFFSCDDLGTEIVTVTAVDVNGNPASCTATVTVEVTEGLPDDWENEDVGPSDPPGFAEFAPCDGEFTVGSTGFNGQLTQDALHIAYQELCGDGVITARVVDISSPTDIPGFAGVIMRKDSTIGSPFASLLTRLSTFVYRRVRATQDAAMINQQLFRPQATWLRLERNGNTITGYTSINGDNWSFAFAANVNLGECILVGLTAESYTQNVPITATFSDVSITGFNPIPLVAPPAGPPAGNQTIGISLYPNPVDEGLNVIIENAPEGEVELEIIDLNGRQLYRQLLDEALPRIEMNLRPLGLPDGVYILRIRVDDQFFVERFIKSKVN
jgi:hypothetical protein